MSTTDTQAPDLTTYPAISAGATVRGTGLMDARPPRHHLVAARDGGGQAGEPSSLSPNSKCLN